MLVAVLVCAGTASAVPLANQFVPVGVIDTSLAVGEDAFGVSYDPVNDLIWHNVGSGTAHAFTPFKNLVIGSLPIDGFTGLPALTLSTGGTTPTGVGGIQALGFDSNTGDLVIHDPAGAGGGGELKEFAPFTGTVGTPIPISAGIAGFIDGLDIEGTGPIGAGTDVYFSPEGGSGFLKSFKNGAIFLDDTSVAQTDISAVSVAADIGTSIVRWAGIEAVTALGTVYTVAATNGGTLSRTVATYDSAGTLLAVDPDGSPFATRLEDLAYDGRYLYGGSLGDSRIFVFDIVGPGGTVIPEPSTLILFLAGIFGVAGFGYVRKQRKTIA
jgi:hypothetical protein